jgi:hypothetical protein
MPAVQHLQTEIPIMRLPVPLLAVLAATALSQDRIEVGEAEFAAPDLFCGG